MSKRSLYQRRIYGYHNWKGDGYIAFDADTGAGVYMINGGYCGGFAAMYVVAAIVNILELLLDIITYLIELIITTDVVIIKSLIVSLNSAVSTLTETIDKFVAYCYLPSLSNFEYMMKQLGLNIVKVCASGIVEYALNLLAEYTDQQDDEDDRDNNNNTGNSGGSGGGNNGGSGGGNSGGSSGGYDEGNIAKNLDTSKISNMTKQEIIDSIPDDWSYTEHNDFVHIRDGDGNIRIRIDPPDKVTNYPHLHVYDSNGNSLDSEENIVDRKSPNGHIPYKTD